MSGGLNEVLEANPSSHQRCTARANSVGQATRRLVGDTQLLVEPVPTAGFSPAEGQGSGTRRPGPLGPVVSPGGSSPMIIPLKEPALAL